MMFSACDVQDINKGNLVADTPQKTAQLLNSAADQTWTLKEIQKDGKTLKLRDGEAYTIVFKEGDLSFGGRADCNVYGGAYKQDQHKLSFENAISTLVYCGEDSRMDDYYAALEDAKIYTLSDLKFELKGNTYMLVFE